MPIRILIADDHGMVAEGLKHVVETQPDMEVVSLAVDGREAVRQARELAPDVVLMDLSMPELNGADATRAILERDPRCRVIVLSMYAEREYVRRALKAGAAGYIVKRSAAKEVVEAIRAVYAGQRYLSARIADVVIDDYAGDERDDPLARLSAREREVLQLLAEGHTGAQIAERLSLSQKTVETYRARLVEKLGIRDVAGLVRFAIQRGIVSLDRRKLSDVDERVERAEALARRAGAEMRGVPVERPAGLVGGRAVRRGTQPVGRIDHRCAHRMRDRREARIDPAGERGELASGQRRVGLAHAHHHPVALDHRLRIEHLAPRRRKHDHDPLAGAHQPAERVLEARHHPIGLRREELERPRLDVADPVVVAAAEKTHPRARDHHRLDFGPHRCRESLLDELAALQAASLDPGHRRAAGEGLEHDGANGRGVLGQQLLDARPVLLHVAVAQEKHRPGGVARDHLVTLVAPVGARARTSPRRGPAPTAA